MKHLLLVTLTLLTIIACNKDEIEEQEIIEEVAVSNCDTFNMAHWRMNDLKDWNHGLPSVMVPYSYTGCTCDEFHFFVDTSALALYSSHNWYTTDGFWSEDDTVIVYEPVTLRLAVQNSQGDRDTFFVKLKYDDNPLCEVIN